MAYRTLYFRKEDGSRSNRFFIFDTVAELLSADLLVGDQAYTVDTDSYYIADSTTTWSAIAGFDGALLLDQTTPQVVINGAPQFDAGVVISEDQWVYLDGL